MDPRSYSRLAERGSLADAREPLRVGDGLVRLGQVDTGLFHRIVGRYHQGEALIERLQPRPPGYLTAGDRS